MDPNQQVQKQPMLSLRHAKAKVLIDAQKLCTLKLTLSENSNFDKVEFLDGYLVVRRKTMNAEYCRLNICKLEPKITKTVVGTFQETDEELRIPFVAPENTTKYLITCKGNKKVVLEYQSLVRLAKIRIN
jgi:hypothetical protein